jgi:hypothetical protein
MELEHLDDCTTQQAFYKIRRAIAVALSREPDSIFPDSNLEECIPRKDRRNTVLTMQKESGLPLNILEAKKWVTSAIVWIVVLSLTGLFFNWKLGLFGLAAGLIGLKVANASGKEFSVRTIGGLAMLSARESYLRSRRNPHTINRLEIVEKIKELFIHELDLTPSLLTRDSIIG